MSRTSLPPTGFRPLAPGDVPTERDIIINSPEGMPYIGPRESIGLPAAQKPVGMGELYPPPPGPMEKIVDFTKDVVVPAAAPTVGGIVGGAVGNRLLPGKGGVVGTSLGNMAGEGFNQLTGITEPSVMAVGASGALPLLPAALRSVVANTPGAEAGLQQLATKVARDIPSRLAPKVDYTDLYEAAKQAGAAVPKGPIAQAAADVGMREATMAPALRLKGVSRALQGVNQLLGFQTGPGQITRDIPLEQLLPNLQRLGELYRSVARKGGPSKMQLATLYGGLQDAIEESARTGTGPGVRALREANAAFKRHLAQGEMESIIQRGIKNIGGHTGFNADTTLNLLDEGHETYQQLVKWVPAKEIADIKETLKVLAKVPGISAAGKGGVGGLQFAQRAVVSGAIGAAVGGPIGAAGGVIAAEALTRALMSPSGRAFVRLVAPAKLGGKGLAFDQIVNAALQVSFPRQPGPTMLGRTARETDDVTGLSMEGQR